MICSAFNSPQLPQVFQPFLQCRVWVTAAPVHVGLETARAAQDQRPQELRRYGTIPGSFAL